MSGLYLHIPFCKTRCAYCDFHTGVQPALKQRLVNALCSELNSRLGELNGDPLQTIYFGGGTPSLLNEDEFEQLFKVIENQCDISFCKEITLEANPDDVTETYVEMLGNFPFNRLSVGVQSFNDEELRLLKRRHTAGEAVDAIERCRQRFSNISIDLMYGLPEQQISAWEHTISVALSLNIKHVSAYHLTYEERTLMGKWLRDKRIRPASEEASVAMYRLLVDTLHEKGIEQYELSNFALPGYASQHNSAYWEGTAYLGVGPSAHSYNGKSRRWNVAHTLHYIEGIERNSPMCEQEVLSENDFYNELLITSLRTLKGLSLIQVAQQFGNERKEKLVAQCMPYISNGIMQSDGCRLHFTTDGLFISDGILANLMISNFN